MNGSMGLATVPGNTQARKKWPGTRPGQFGEFAKILIAAGGPNAAPRRLRGALRLRCISIGQQRLLRSCDGGLRRHDRVRTDVHAIVEDDQVLIRETHAAARSAAGDRW